MTQSLATAMQADADAAKRGPLTTMLRHGLGRVKESPGTEQVELLEEALTLAAQAERQMDEQRRRIVGLESLLVTDELTGLLNRRGLCDQMARMLAMADRHGGRGVVAYVDLDNFKAINDRLGHAAGDAALRRVAEILAANTRTADVVARIGGDEFVALLVQSGWRWGQARARQLQRMVNRSFARYDQYRIPIRVSLGIEGYRPGDDPEDLLRRADEAMFSDKRERSTLVHIASARVAREQGSDAVPAREPPKSPQPG